MIYLLVLVAIYINSGWWYCKPIGLTTEESDAMRECAEAVRMWGK